MRRVLLAFWVAATCGICAGGNHARAAQPLCSTSSGHIAMVVEHADGSTLQRCVALASTGASGKTVLADSGLEYSTVSYGGGLGDALCQVDNEPATYPPSCFQSGAPYSVIFSQHPGSSWIVSAAGLSNLQLSSGDALGLRYEKGPTPPAALSIPCPPPATSAPTTAAPVATLRLAARPGSVTQTASTPTNSSTPSQPQASPPASATPSPTAGVAALHTTGPTDQRPTGGPSPSLIAGFLCFGSLGGVLLRQVLARRK